MRLIPYLGLRFTRRGLRPYAGVRLSLSSSRRKPVRTATHVHRTVVHCSNCGALVSRLDAKYCRRCGAQFTRRIIEQ